MKRLIVFCIILSCKSLPNHENFSFSISHLPILDTIYSSLEVGDIVFRAGTDIESDIIRKFSRKDKTYSHCGIVVQDEDSLRVLHILGGQDNVGGSILHESLNGFVNFPHNTDIGIYKLLLKPQEIEQTLHYIDSLKQHMITFDLSFNLYDKDKRYCTELIIDAIKYGSPQFTQRPAVFTVANTKWQFLANHNKEFLFYPIDEFQYSKILQLKKTFSIPLE